MKKTMSLCSDGHKKKKKKTPQVNKTKDSIYDRVRKAFYDAKHSKKSERAYDYEGDDDFDDDEEWY